ncbi:hypothetical protein ACJ72_06966 [Emergomyces africanus]|uniref:Uncharacterized protein n=1 Tax=Emergomyces africanus TaxID=1955775 RepID=A0A1B7NPH6_9EURO|nr:hypothetical protein ACJ72_06966 [Emergomyces africanus]
MTVVADTAWVAPDRPRAVTTEEGREFARRLGCKYVELSSKDNEPVVAVVTDLIREHRAGTRQIASPIAHGRAQPTYRDSPKKSVRSLARFLKRRASRIFK